MPPAARVGNNARLSQHDEVPVGEQYEQDQKALFMELGELGIGKLRGEQRSARRSSRRRVSKTVIL